MADGGTDAPEGANVRVYGGLSLARYAETMAHLRHFPRHLADEVLGLLGIDLDAWQVAIEGWTGVMVDGERREREAVAIAFGVVFPRKLRELEEAMVTLESLRALAEEATADETEDAPGTAEVEEDTTPVTVPEPPRSAAAPLRVVTERETWAPCELSAPDETLVRPVGRNVGPVLPFQAGSPAPSTEVWARMAAARPLRSLSYSAAEGAAGVDETAVPLGGSAPSQPLGLERLASLTVDLSQPGVDRAAVLLRYGFVAEIEWRAVEAELLRRMQRDGDLYRRWVGAVKQYQEWVAGRGP